MSEQKHNESIVDAAELAHLRRVEESARQVLCVPEYLNRAQDHDDAERRARSRQQKADEASMAEEWRNMAQDKMDALRAALNGED